MPKRGQDWFVGGLRASSPTSNEEAKESLDREGMIALQTLGEEELEAGGSRAFRPEGPGPALTSQGVSV